MINPMMLIKPNRFAPTSRYYSIETATLIAADGTTITYLGRRFVPSQDQFSVLIEHTVADGERLDNITAHYMDDPEQFWRICDANNARDPNELTDTVGRSLRITLPQGIPGTRNA
jgi:hypothetical protein